MKQCEVCGNRYDKCFSVITYDEVAHIFDCLECAIQALAPKCSRCDCHIIGHGLEDCENYYCCVHCAKSAGNTAFRDRTY